MCIAMLRGGLQHLVEMSDKLLSTKVVKEENLSSFHMLSLAT